MIDATAVDDLAGPRGGVESGRRGGSAMQQILLVGRVGGLGGGSIFDLHLGGRRRTVSGGVSGGSKRYGRYDGHVDVQNRRRGKRRWLRRRFGARDVVVRGSGCVHGGNIVRIFLPFGSDRCLEL